MRTTEISLTFRRMVKKMSFGDSWQELQMDEAAIEQAYEARESVILRLLDTGKTDHSDFESELNENLHWLESAISKRRQQFEQSMSRNSRRRSCTI